MPRKNRPYKRGEPFRDARLFVIACEGAKTEKLYFEGLVANKQRVKVKILAPVEENHGKSAPKWILDRAATYVEEFGLAKDDQLWLVMDVDKWMADALREINEHCMQQTNWYTAYSNPCFEIWLLLHILDFTDSENYKAQELKQKLHAQFNGGYKVEHVLPHLENAIQRASGKDKNPTFFLPEPMTTKVYKLAIELQDLLKQK